MSHKVGRRASAALHPKDENAWEWRVQYDTHSLNQHGKDDRRETGSRRRQEGRPEAAGCALCNKTVGISFSIRNPKQFKPVGMLCLSSEQVSGLLSPCIMWLGASSLDLYRITCSCGSHVSAPRYALSLSSASWIKGTRAPSPEMAFFLKRSCLCLFFRFHCVEPEWERVGSV